jgi:signal peptidase II
VAGALPAIARLAAALLAVALLLVADGASKRWAASELRARGPRTVAGGHLRLRYHENPGFAFGLWRGERRPVGFTVSSAVVAAVLLGLLVRQTLHSGAGGFWPTAGLAALLAGTLGNLRDRLERGHVVDFIDCSANGVVRWPLFNVADGCLGVGLAVCLTWLAVAALRTRPHRAAG